MLGYFAFAGCRYLQGRGVKQSASSSSRPPVLKVISLSKPSGTRLERRASQERLQRYHEHPCLAKRRLWCASSATAAKPHDLLAPGMAGFDQRAAAAFMACSGVIWPSTQKRMPEQCCDASANGFLQHQCRHRRPESCNACSLCQGQSPATPAAAALASIVAWVTLRFRFVGTAGALLCYAVC